MKITAFKFFSLPLYLAGLGLAIMVLGSTTGHGQSLFDSVPAASTAPLPEVYKPKRLFTSARGINFQTVDMPAPRNLEFRIAHRFGNLASPGTHYHTLFGLDQAEDILIHFEYGITSRTSLSGGRAKGNGPLRELWHGALRQSILQYGQQNSPVSLTYYGNISLSTQVADPFMPAGEGLKGQPFARRMSYFTQLLVARPLNKIFTLQVAPALVYRNYVPANDANGLVFLPVTLRTKLSGMVSILAEYAPLLAATGPHFRGNGPIFYEGQRPAPGQNNWYVPLHLGVEVETGGHIFTMNITNSAGTLENDFLPYNNRSYGRGEFRLGFTILRWFQL